MSAPSRRQAIHVRRAVQRAQVEQYIEGLIQRTAARGIAAIEQHLKEAAR